MARPASPRFKRRKVLIDRKLQLGLSVTIVLLLASYFVLFCILAAYLPSMFAESDLDVGERVATVARGVVDTFGKILLPLVLTFIFLALHIIVLTHRVAGPAFRFKKALGRILARDLTDEIHLRAGDYMVDLAEGINEATARVRQDLEEASRVAESLAEGAQSLASRSAGPAADQANELAAKAESLGALLGEYRLESEAE